MRSCWAFYRFLVLLALWACGSSEAVSPEQQVHATVEYGVVGMVAIGDTVRPRLFDAQSHEVLATAWSSSDPTIASVGSTGLVFGVRKGTATIHLSAGKRSASVQVVVGGMLHKNDITASESWTADDGPHVVDTLLKVGAAGGAVLTIGPGVTVFFKKPGAGLDFGVNGRGSLVADGSSAPIILRSQIENATPGAWHNLTFRGAERSTLINVTLRSCGGITIGNNGTNGPPPAACIVLLNGPFDPNIPSILIDNVTIADGRYGAIELEGRSHFAAGSRLLSVASMRGHVGVLRAGGASGFPIGGTFTDVDTNEVRLLSDTLGASATWASIGFAWHLLGPVYVEGSATPALTIAAGSTVTASFGAGFVVGMNAPGSLRVGAPTGGAVTMTTADEDDWVGVEFFPHAVSSSITNTTLRRCGNYTYTGYGAGCVFIIGDFAGHGPTPVLKNVTIDSAYYAGLVTVAEGRFGAGSTDLTITRTRGRPLEIYVDAIPTIPAGSYGGNDDDEILLYSAEITQSMTLRNLGIPYLFLHGLGVQGPANPILTIAAGTELRFGVATYLVAGYVAPGGLRALGTAQSPVRFASSLPNEHPGWWIRILFGELADPTSLLDHVIIESAGGEDRGAAGVEFLRDIGPVLQNSTIRYSAGCGVLRTGGPWSTDFTAPALANQFQHLAGAPQCGP